MTRANIIALARAVETMPIIFVEVSAKVPYLVCMAYSAK